MEQFISSKRTRPYFYVALGIVICTGVWLYPCLYSEMQLHSRCDKHRPDFVWKLSSHLFTSIVAREFFSYRLKPVNTFILKYCLWQNLDILLFPSAEAFLFQDLLNLSQIIEKKGGLFRGRRTGSYCASEG
ncbi:hypothetical protein CRM22_000365 [Opisthorchis felineus]|uniref:Uncharacterized protein n=1 Tax=Opisthorchis felineus TaxID=147828 RepID=A0A4S2MFB6_OPIFE|nr:hypothetical protein CRM22_000365 [Opisthorchis felineus]